MEPVWQPRVLIADVILKACGGTRGRSRWSGCICEDRGLPGANKAPVRVRRVDNQPASCPLAGGGHIHTPFTPEGFFFWTDNWNVSWSQRNWVFSTFSSGMSCLSDRRFDLRSSSLTHVCPGVLAVGPVAGRRLHDVCVEGSGVTDRQEVKRRITSGPSVKNGHASVAWR